MREHTHVKPHVVPPAVAFAKSNGDYGALSRMGRAGAMRKKEIAEKDKEFARQEAIKTETRMSKKIRRDSKCAAANDDTFDED